jgi:ACR3 family arsenite efflux pump ArsB
MYPTAKVKYEQMGEGLKNTKVLFVSKPQLILMFSITLFFLNDPEYMIGVII